MSKAKLIQSVKALNMEAVVSLLQTHPELARVRDEPAPRETAPDKGIDPGILPVVRPVFEAERPSPL